MKQGKAEPNDDLKIRFDDVYETMELDGGDSILHSKKLTKKVNFRITGGHLGSVVKGGVS